MSIEPVPAVPPISIVSAIDPIPEIKYYYDSHPTPEDLMGESTAQDLPSRYLIGVLMWMYPSDSDFVARNFQMYQTNDPMEVPLSPDAAVFKGVPTPDPHTENIKSWRVGAVNRSVPNVVFEFASDDTKTIDVTKKPAKYARMGAREYYSYDARPRIRRKTPRLRGWSPRGGVPVEMTADERGWLWSEELESWLVPDGPYLRLYDQDGEPRLTGEEAERAAKEAAWAKLRELGIDPETLSS